MSCIYIQSWTSRLSERASQQDSSMSWERKTFGWPCKRRATQNWEREGKGNDNQFGKKKARQKAVKWGRAGDSYTLSRASSEGWNGGSKFDEFFIEDWTWMLARKPWCSENTASVQLRGSFRDIWMVSHRLPANKCISVDSRGKQRRIFWISSFTYTFGWIRTSRVPHCSAPPIAIPRHLLETKKQEI